MSSATIISLRTSDMPIHITCLSTSALDHGFPQRKPLYLDLGWYGSTREGSPTSCIFVVLKPIHKVFFNPSVVGIYYHDAWEKYFALVNTFEENMEGFTRWKISEENMTRSTMANLGNL